MNDKILTGFTVVLFAAGLGTIAWVLINSMLLQQELSEEGELSCVHQRVERTMQDEFMAGALNQGDGFEVLMGYYKCNPVQRKDLVYFRISAPLEPVVRRVHGLPGDQFEVVAAEVPGTYRLRINGEGVQVAGSEYVFTSGQTPPLKTYEIARKGVLGPQEYIVLSDVQPGAADSATLGIVKLSAFEGKALP